jgi:4-oxalomesaconate hydratase
MKKKLLVIGAHSADFVWRSAGTIAKAIEEGAETLVVCMSYGERGESGELWKENPQRSVDNVKEIRHEQAQKAADILGTPIQFLDWGDYPMLISDERITQLTHIIGDFEPTVILTHSEKDPFNPDHPLAFQATQRARLLSCGAGVPSAFKNIDPPAWYSFEPHQPELCGFLPDTYIDITSVMEKNGSDGLYGCSKVPQRLLCRVSLTSWESCKKNFWTKKCSVCRSASKSSTKSH